MTDHFGGSDVTTPATSLFGGFDGGAPPQGEYLYQRNYSYTLFGGINTYTYDYALCGRTAMLRVTFKL